MHTYADFGVYDVTLTVETTHGSDTTLPLAITVLETIAPTASFTATPLEGYQPLDVTFTNTSDLGTGDLVSYLWDFGDGTTSAEISPMHTYVDAGTYSVSLEITTTHGVATAEIIDLVTVIPLSNVSIPLTSGWQWVGINIEPSNASISDILDGIIGLGVVSDGSGNLYIPDMMDMIGNWDNLSGYAIGMHEADVLSIDGIPINPATPITIDLGWNFVSYLPENAMAVETAMTGISDGLAVVKDHMGNYYIPEYGINQMGNMNPTCGYKIGHYTGGTLVYPDATNYAKSYEPIVRQETMHYRVPQNNGESYAVLVQLNESMNLALGAEIGLFNSNDECIGASMYDGADITPVTAWKSVNDLIGYTPGEEIKIRVFSENQEIVTDLTTTSYYEDGFFSVVELNMQVIPEMFRLHDNYPNPFNPATIIAFDVPQLSKVTLSVFDITGRQITILEDNVLNAGNYCLEWNGHDSFGKQIASGVYFYRLSAESMDSSVRFSETKKMVLLR